MDHAQIRTAAGSSKPDARLIVTGTQGNSFSSRLKNESVRHGIILAVNVSISFTLGFVFGEIIGGESINTASGGSVQETSVPDAGSTILLMSIGLGCLAAAKRKSFS